MLSFRIWISLEFSSPCVPCTCLSFIALLCSWWQSSDVKMNAANKYDLMSLHTVPLLSPLSGEAAPQVMQICSHGNKITAELWLHFTLLPIMPHRCNFPASGNRFTHSMCYVSGDHCAGWWVALHKCVRPVVGKRAALNLLSKERVPLLQTEALHVVKLCALKIKASVTQWLLHNSFW